MTQQSTYWFPAKRYGWGWGLPCAWQGWAVFGAFFAMLMLGVVLLPPGKNLMGFEFWTVAVSGALLAVCWLKGEPPRWRWGKD